MTSEYPQGNISALGLTTFARRVAGRTGRFVAIEVTCGSQISSGELTAAATQGRVTGGDAFAGPMEAMDPLFGLSSLPFIVQTFAAAHDLNERARPAYEAALARHGLTLLYTTIWPPTGLWSDRHLATGRDTRSLAIRVYDYKSAQVFEAAGFRAEYLPFHEIMGKLKTRHLNAVLTSGDGGAGQSLWDELRYFTAINYAVPISLAFIRTDAIATLPRHVRDGVLLAAQDTQESQRALLESRTRQNYLRMAENGVSIADPPSKEITHHLRTSATPIVAAWKKKVDDDIARHVTAASAP